jgi:mannose-6-phosphate isomerase-like protein (cupin superfamily)
MDIKPIEPISFPTGETHIKSWGGEFWIKNFEKYCLKILRFDAGKDFSFHQHFLKEETWYILEGELLMEYYDLSNADLLRKELRAGDIVHIPAGNPHKLYSKTNATVLEASSQHFNFDSYRIGKGASQK